MSEDNAKQKWKEEQRQKRIHRRLEEEIRSKAIKEAEKLRLKTEIADSRNSIRKFWVNTLPWFFFLPVTILLILFFDGQSLVLKGFLYISVAGCFFSYSFYRKHIRKSPMCLYNEFLKRTIFVDRPTRLYHSAALFGVLLSLLIAFFFYLAYQWVAFALASINIFLYFFLSFFFLFVLEESD